MHARSSSFLRGAAAGLALLLLTGCDRGAAEPNAQVAAVPPGRDTATAPLEATPAAADAGLPAEPPAEPPAAGPPAEPPAEPSDARPPTGADRRPGDTTTPAGSGPTAVGEGDGKFVPPPNPNRLPPKPLIEPTLAQMTFTETVRNFGPVTDTMKHQTSFEFVNTGPQKLVIADIKASCSCTVPRLRKREYAPGEGGRIDVVFDPNKKKGVVEQEVTIISNSRDGIATLKVSADVKPLINVDFYARLGEMQLFEEHRAVVPMKYIDPDLEFNEISVNDPFITAKLLRKGVVHSGEGANTVYRADLELTVSRDHPWGGLFARRAHVTVTGRWKDGGEPLQHKYTIFVLGSVFGELRAKPQVAAFGQMKRNQELQKSIRITRPSGEPFKLERAWVTDMRTIEPNARIEQINATEWLVVLTAYSQDPGEISGTLHISTNVPGEELLQIPISGRVG